MIMNRTVRGLKVACWVNDKGFADGRRNLVFVHRSGRDHAIWWCQYGDLQDYFNVAAIDLLGHAASEGTGKQSQASVLEIPFSSAILSVPPSVLHLLFSTENFSRPLSPWEGESRCPSTR